jgi:poly(A) polymerase
MSETGYVAPRNTLSCWLIVVGVHLREIVLGRVSALVKQFVKKVALDRGLSETAATTAGGKIFTFGSYRLGVHGPGTDIDTLCVVPKHVSREDFFEVFEPMLKEMDGASEISVSSLRSIFPLHDD